MSFQVDGQYIPGLEIQYNCEHNLPPSQQLMEWYRDRDAWDKGGTHITHMCTECTGHNTRWLYQDWTVCYDCMIPFSSNAGAKLEQEYWDYLREERQTDITEMDALTQVIYTAEREVRMYDQIAFQFGEINKQAKRLQE